MKNIVRYSPEVRERAVRLVFSQQHEYPSRWSALTSISSKIGCTPESLRRGVRRAEVDQGSRGGVISEGVKRLKSLEREVRELRRANEILRKAAAFFAQAELDRRPR